MIILYVLLYLLLGYIIVLAYSKLKGYSSMSLIDMLLWPITIIAIAGHFIWTYEIKIKEKK
jgi:hypothetical protein